jgi:hypothetical protein
MALEAAKANLLSGSAIESIYELNRWTPAGATNVDAVCTTLWVTMGVHRKIPNGCIIAVWTRHSVGSAC